MVCWRQCGNARSACQGVPRVRRDRRPSIRVPMTRAGDDSKEIDSPFRNRNGFPFFWCRKSVR